MGAGVRLSVIAQPDDATRLGEILRSHLVDEQWSDFRCAVAFAKRSGIRYVADQLESFCKRGVATIAVGVDLKGTSIEALLDIGNAISGESRLLIFHNENPSTFHPKVYCFRNEEVDPPPFYVPVAMRVCCSAAYSAGVRYPSDECGRSWLYSYCHLLDSSFASSRLPNNSCSSSSSRSLPLKLSA